MYDSCSLYQCSGESDVCEVDLSQAVSLASMYIVNPRKEHWMMVKHIPMYLKGTSSVGLIY